MMGVFLNIYDLIYRLSSLCYTAVLYKPLQPKLECSSVHSFYRHVPPPSSLLLSPPSLSLDFPRSDSCVCCGGFPSHCNGKVCFPQLAVCEEELAVCHIWHWCLHQLYDYHVSQRGRCLDKHHLACLHTLSNNHFFKPLFRTLLQELSHPQPERHLIWDSSLPLCLMLMTLLNLSPVDAYEYYHLARCMKRWPICWQI